MSFACSSPAGGMLFGVSGLLLLLLIRLRNGQILDFATAFKYLGSFVQNDVSQDKELNRRIGLAAMTFGKLKSMVFTSKKVSLRVKINILFSHGFISSSAWNCRIMGLFQNPTV